METPVEFEPRDLHASPNVCSLQNTSRYEFRVALKDAKGPINALTLSKDATVLLSGGDDGKVRVYNTATSACEQVLQSESWGQVTALSWLTVDPPVDEKAISVCVGTGRGVITLCPMSKATTWLVWKDSQTFTPFVFNDAVEGQAYDALNCRLAVASHSGIFKVYSVDKCVNLTALWNTSVGGAIPRGLQFFGGANQFILSVGLETGEIICRDAQTSNVQWRKWLLGGVGNATLSPDEMTLIVDNITTGKFDVHKFPSSTPTNSLPFSSIRRYTKQCAFSEAGKVAVCGSDHGKVYVADVASGELLQTLQSPAAFSLIQVVAAGTSEDGRHLIAAGTSAAAGQVFIWEKRPPVVEPARSTVVRTELKISKQGFMNALFIVLLVFVSYPNWAPPIKKSIAAKETPIDSSIPVVHGTDTVTPRTLKHPQKQIREEQQGVSLDNLANQKRETMPVAIAVELGRFSVIETRATLKDLEDKDGPNVQTSDACTRLVLSTVSASLETNIIGVAASDGGKLQFFVPKHKENSSPEIHILRPFITKSHAKGKRAVQQVQKETWYSTAGTNMDVDRAVKGRSLVSVLNDRNDKHELEIESLQKTLHKVENEMAELRARGRQDLDIVKTELFQAHHELAQQRCSALLVELAHDSKLQDALQELCVLKETSRAQETEMACLLKELQDLRCLPEKLKESEIANGSLRQEADGKMTEIARLSMELRGSENTIQALRKEAAKQVLEIARLSGELSDLRPLREKLKDSERQNTAILQRVKKAEEGYVFLEQELETLRSQHQDQRQMWKLEKDSLAEATQQTETLRAIACAVSSLFQCSVCYNVMRRPIRLDCGHMFCVQCITKWSDASATCPSCREEFGKLPNPFVMYGYPEVLKLLRKHGKKLKLD